MILISLANLNPRKAKAYVFKSPNDSPNQQTIHRIGEAETVDGIMS